MPKPRKVSVVKSTARKEVQNRRTRSTIGVKERRQTVNKPGPRRMGNVPDHSLDLNPKSPPIPLKWPGKKTELAAVDVDGQEFKALVLTEDMVDQWNKILRLSNKIMDCTESKERMNRSLNRLQGIFREGTQETPLGLFYRGGRSEEEVIGKLELFKGRTQKIVAKLEESETELETPRRELYNTMCKLLTEAGVLDWDETEWFKEYDVLDPYRPRWEEDQDFTA